MIARNQLAVVLGAEYSELFDCREGREICTPDHVGRRLDEIHEAGVRSIFPVHRFDNAFGGTRMAGGTSGAWMNLSTKVSTSEIDNLLDLADPSKLLIGPVGGHYWEVGDCPDDVRGVTDLSTMDDFVTEEMSAIVGDAVAGFLRNRLGPYPDYRPFQGRRACNRRGLHPLGRHLVEAMMDRGMIVEVDHMSYAMLLDTLDLLESRSYAGLVSSHDWIENRPEVRERIFALGGLMSPIRRSPRSMVDRIRSLSAEMARHPFPIGVGIGTDTQGIAGQPGGEADVVIEYPFPSVDGRVLFHRPRTGNRTFDFASEGVAHYGLYPEWVETLRQVASAEELEIFLRSAEAYVQMWERAEAAAAARPGRERPLE